MKAACLSLVVALSAAPAFAEDLAGMAFDSLRTCSEHFPDSRATADALKIEGWRYEGNLGGSFHFFTRQGRRVVTALTTTAYRDDACMTLVSKLTPAQASDLAEKFLEGTKSVKLTEAELKKLGDDDFIAGWKFPLRGKPVILVATKPVNMKIVRGSALILTDLPK